MELEGFEREIKYEMASWFVRYTTRGVVYSLSDGKMVKEKQYEEETGELGFRLHIHLIIIINVYVKEPPKEELDSTSVSNSFNLLLLLFLFLTYAYTHIGHST